eukprot:886178-Rhodomonas_salina.3
MTCHCSEPEVTVTEDDSTSSWQVQVVTVNPSQLPRPVWYYTVNDLFPFFVTVPGVLRNSYCAETLGWRTPIHRRSRQPARPVEALSVRGTCPGRA